MNKDLALKKITEVPSTQKPKLSAEDEDFLADYIDKFWVNYYPGPILKCKNKGGSAETVRAICKVLRLADDWKAEAHRIEYNTKQLIQQDIASKKAGQFVPYPPMIPTYFNQGRYDRDIEEVREKSPVYALCNQDGCEQVAAVLGWCEDHAQGNVVSNDWKQVHLDALQRIGMSKRAEESVNEWQMRCREWCGNHGYPPRSVA